MALTALTAAERDALDTLEIRIRAMLPAEYQDTYETVQPVSMGSAGLKYDAAGKVAWNDIWQTFCDLAMAGGPPHKGVLLEPASSTQIDAQPERYADVVAEICRGITMATGLTAKPSPVAGWVRVFCTSKAMASWLHRAIVMENVAAHSTNDTLDLPASPAFRLEKEIKNVVTVIAKTTHYWAGHMLREQQRAIAVLLAGMATNSPLIEPAASPDPATSPDEVQATAMADAIQQQTGLPRSRHRYAGWLGIDCPSVALAIWMMRALVVSNILARREETTLFVPVNGETDPGGATVIRGVVMMQRFAEAKGVPSSPLHAPDR